MEEEIQGETQSKKEITIKGVTIPIRMEMQCPKCKQLAKATENRCACGFDVQAWLLQER